MVNHRLKLNQNQTHILQLLYKFRFATAQLLANRHEISLVASTNSLKILRSRGLIDRRYDKKYRLLGIGAVYYLTKNGIRYLRGNFNIDERAIHAMYKNASASEPFAQHCLDVLRVYLNLRSLYPDTFEILTRPEVLEFAYMPEPTPDLYLNRINPSEGTTDEYMLDILTDTQFFIIKKRINLYIEHFEAGDWPKETYPTILIVCDGSNLEDKIGKHIQKQLDDSYIDEHELVFMVTTKKALLSPNYLTSAIWSNTYNPEKTLELHTL